MLSNNPDTASFKQVEDFLKDEVYFLYKTGNQAGHSDFKYRLFFEKAREGKKTNPNKIATIVFGKEEITPAILNSDQGQELLTHLHETSEGSKILKTMELSRFEPAREGRLRATRPGVGVVCDP